MSRSIWKGPYINYSILKLNYEYTKQLSNQRLDQKSNQRLNNENKIKDNNIQVKKQTNFTMVNPIKKNIKIWSRHSIILPKFLGLRMLVYNGQKFIPIKILPEMIGYKFGSFCMTRKYTKKFLNTQKMQKKKK